MESIKSKFLIISGTLIIIFTNCSDHKVFKKEYYPGTRIVKSEGNYLNNHPIDIIKSYFKSGTLASIDVYDSNGILNGECFSFYENGLPSEIAHYRNGIENGRYVSCRTNGSKKLVGFLFNGKPVGDAYFYDSLNNLVFYNFLNFHNEAVMAREYDSSGKLLEKKGNFYLIDSLNIRKGPNGVDTFDIWLLLSHQPGTTMAVRIENVGKDGRILHSANIGAENQFAHYKNIIGNNVDSIKEIGVVYDTTMKKLETFTNVLVTKYFR
jgi:antitoxin component YwqK of YwqJK toxin-antitoxin module